MAETIRDPYLVVDQSLMTGMGTEIPGYILVCSEHQEPLRPLRSFLWDHGLPAYASSSSRALDLAVRKMGAPSLLVVEHGHVGRVLMRDVLELRTHSHVPILSLVPAPVNQLNQANLRLVGDDFVMMPWDQSELLLRTRRLCAAPRLETAPPTERPFTSVPRTTAHANATVEFSATEQQILQVLNRAVGKFVPHADIIENLPGDDVQTKLALMRVTIYRIRRKIEPHPHYPVLLITHAPGGYELTKVIDTDAFRRK